MTTPIIFIIPGACSLGPQIVMEFAKVPYQIMSTTPEIRASKEFLNINHHGKVAAIKDGDFVVGENTAIIAYLQMKYLKGSVLDLSDASVEDHTRVIFWLSSISTELHPAFGRVILAKRFVDENCLDSFMTKTIENLTNKLKGINDRLNGRKYLALDKLTSADCQAYAILRWINSPYLKDPTTGKQRVNIEEFPNIKNFLAMMEEIPEVKNAMAIEKGKAEGLEGSKFAGYFTF